MKVSHFLALPSAITSLIERGQPRVWVCFALQVQAQFEKDLEFYSSGFGGRGETFAIQLPLWNMIRGGGETAEKEEKDFF